MALIDIAKPRPRLSGEARQQQIVETVLDLVVEHGADGVSVQAIADRIGLTQPAVFRHFRSKEAIWVAVMTWLEEQLGRPWPRSSSRTICVCNSQACK